MVCIVYFSLCGFYSIYVREFVSRGKPQCRSGYFTQAWQNSDLLNWEYFVCCPIGLKLFTKQTKSSDNLNYKPSRLGGAKTSHMTEPSIEKIMANVVLSLCQYNPLVCVCV